MLHPYCEKIQAKTLEPHATSRAWFLPTELKTIYNFPECPRPPKYAVISFGGGLFGTIAPDGTVSGGDLEAYWSYLSLPTRPIVKAIFLQNERNTTSDALATAENTLDIQTIGGCRPESTIVLIRVSNSFASFLVAMNYILNDTTFTNISISWGAPEIYYPRSILQSIDTLFARANVAGLTICGATGDHGSNNNVGLPGSFADFPASSPNVIACGGTKLRCPNRVYDTSTIETAWSLGGGARSAFFAKPAYQNNIQTSSFRSIPDVALVSDPNTGVLFYVNGTYVVYGGTSVASPLMASAIGGRSSMLDKLYVFPRIAFHDIVSGSNGAFSATVGYDLCSGLGSINGSNFMVPGPAESLSISASSWSTVAGKTLDITVSGFPANSLVTDPFVWSSSNSRVVSLSKTTGSVVTLRALSAGSAIVTITAGQLSVSCAVTSLSAPIRLQTGNVTIRRSKTFRLTATNVPVGSTIVWTSSNTRIASVVSGLVTANSSGSCTISANCNGWIATCKVTVK